MHTDLLKNSRPWIFAQRKSGVVVSSRIRLARNIKGAAFPWKAGVEESRRIFARISDALSSLDCLDNPVVIPIEKIDSIDREVLCERRLISGEMVLKGAGSGMVVAEKQHVCVMINEEDHLRMQVIRPGLDLTRSWRLLDCIDSELDGCVEYAYSAELGYLTACPTNVGTGLRVSVMLHLPGLKWMHEMDSVINGLNRMGLAVRGTFGEGSEDFGNMYQISNQATLGIREIDTVRQIQKIAETVVELELNARERLMEKQRIRVYDFIGRAVGISRYAKVISSGEALDILSGLRLGVNSDMVRGVSLGKINSLMLLVQPGHLQKKAGKELSTLERDTFRARLIRDGLKDVEIYGDV